MRRMLSLILVTLAVAACQDAVAPAPRGAPALDGIPLVPG
jgi:hypothetical protein